MGLARMSYLFAVYKRNGNVFRIEASKGTRGTEHRTLSCATSNGEGTYLSGSSRDNILSPGCLPRKSTSDPRGVDTAMMSAPRTTTLRGVFGFWRFWTRIIRHKNGPLVPGIARKVSSRFTLSSPGPRPPT